MATNSGGLRPADFKDVNIQKLRVRDSDVTAQVRQLAGAETGFTARKVATLALVGNDLATAVRSWRNPEAGAILVERAVANITTASTGASTLNVGITTVSATTGSDTLLDGISGAAVAVFDSVNDTDNGTNGVAKVQRLASGGWVTVAEATGAAEGLVGTLYIYYTVI
jgi:hypothetical protein